MLLLTRVIIQFILLLVGGILAMTQRDDSFKFQKHLIYHNDDFLNEYNIHFYLQWCLPYKSIPEKKSSLIRYSLFLKDINRAPFTNME